MTEKTDDTIKRTAGWVLIDGDCHLCRTTSRRWERTLHAMGYRVAPLVLAEAAGLLRTAPQRDEMIVITRHHRRRHGGADGIVALMREHPLTRPLTPLYTLAPIRRWARRAYAAIAARRHQIGCALTRSAMP